MIPNDLFIKYEIKEQKVRVINIILSPSLNPIPPTTPMPRGNAGMVSINRRGEPTKLKTLTMFSFRLFSLEIKARKENHLL
jgi:hypothetical protein